VDLQSGRVLYEVDARTHVNSVAISREAGRFLSGGDSSWSAREERGWPLRVWDLGSGKELMTLSGHTGPINSVAVTSDAGLAVSGSSDRLVKVWDLRKGKLLYTLSEHTDDVKAVAIMPDNRFAMAGSHSGLITVWEMATGRVVARFTGDAFIGALTGLNDNRTLVVGDGLGRLYCLRLQGEGNPL
jgi:WD40 repeat protein